MQVIRVAKLPASIDQTVFLAFHQNLVNFLGVSGRTLHQMAGQTMELNLGIIWMEKSGKIFESYIIIFESNRSEAALKHSENLDE